MNLTEHQLKYFSIKKYKIILLQFILSIIHFYSVIYVFNLNEHNKNSTFKNSVTFSSLYCIISTFSSLISSYYLKKNKKYSIINITLNINVNNDDDLEIIQSKKYLYKNIKKIIVDILQIFDSRIDIKNVINTTNGIKIDFMYCQLTDNDDNINKNVTK